MGRRFLAIACATLLGACDDPLVIIGDLPGFMRVVAGIPDSSGVRVDSIATRARVSSPLSVAADSTGNFYVSDSRSRVMRITSNGRFRILLNHDPCFEKTCVGRPQGIAVAPDGAILIADDMSDKIWRLNPVNGEVRAIAGTGVHGVAPDETPAAQATLASPSSITVLADGRIAFAERNSNRIRVIGTDGVLRTLAANLNLPTGITVSGGQLFVTETGTHTIQFIDLASGARTQIAGNGNSGYGGDNGPALQATFNFPAAVAVSDNNLYVSDQLNHRVRLINLQTGLVTTFAGTGALTYSGNGRAAAETALNRPAGLAITRFGFLYIADSGHHIIWRTPIRANLQ